MYHNKYIKYKNKYINAKYEQQLLIGGKKNIIIHISGASGSGKTTLGKKLTKKFGNKIVVTDIDDLRREFMNSEYPDNNADIKKFNKNGYQKWIDNFVAKQTKPLVFVGLNNMPWNKAL
jgi:adenylylsulfate kinase-like enzyme